MPLYRQYVTATEKANSEIPSIRMMGQNISQRSNLTANHGQYYIDTTVGLAASSRSGPSAESRSGYGLNRPRGRR